MTKYYSVPELYREVCKGNHTLNSREWVLVDRLFERMFTMVHGMPPHITDWVDGDRVGRSFVYNKSVAAMLNNVVEDFKRPSRAHAPVKREMGIMEVRPPLLVEVWSKVGEMRGSNSISYKWFWDYLTTETVISGISQSDGNICFTLLCDSAKFNGSMDLAQEHLDNYRLQALLGEVGGCELDLELGVVLKTVKVPADRSTARSSGFISVFSEEITDLMNAFEHR